VQPCGAQEFNFAVRASECACTHARNAACGLIREWVLE